MKKTIIILLIGMAAAIAGFGQIVHPRDLKYPPLTFTPPDPLQFRSVLGDGLRTYVVVDHSVPVVNVTAYVRFGALYDAEEKTGLADLMGPTLIKGGTATRTGEEIEKRIDFLGGNLSFRPVNEQVAALSLSILSKDLDEALAIFFDVLRSPEFRDDSLTIAKGRILENLRQANDQPRTVLSREYERLLYGDHPLTRNPLKSTVDALTRTDLKTAHTDYFYPKNTILAVSGDFQPAVLKKSLAKLARGWKNRNTVFPVAAKTFPTVPPGVYFIQKKINQGYISMGHMGIEESDPDYFAVQVMNFILGGGSFTSRITSKVRSDEGLAYNCGSRFNIRPRFPGTFSGYVQTKSSTVGYAIELIRREFERIRKEPVQDQEMETALNFYQESFANLFASPAQVAESLAQLEMDGKPFDYYKTYRQKYNQVTKEMVMAAAQKFIHPDRLAVMIVGDWDACNVKSEKFQQTLEVFGPIHKIALIDFITGKEANQ